MKDERLEEWKQRPKHAAKLNLVERNDAYTTLSTLMVVVFINDSTYVTIPIECIYLYIIP